LQQFAKIGNRQRQGDAASFGEQAKEIAGEEPDMIRVSENTILSM
jgi:hypothetical protein